MKEVEGNQILIGYYIPKYIFKKYTYDQMNRVPTIDRKGSTYIWMWIKCGIRAISEIIIVQRNSGKDITNTQKPTLTGISLLHRSFVYTRKSIGPNTVPCGTPYNMKIIAQARSNFCELLALHCVAWDIYSIVGFILTVKEFRDRMENDK